MKITGAQAAIKSLEQEGVEVMFGIPGGAILPFYDPILEEEADRKVGIPALPSH